MINAMLGKEAAGIWAAAMMFIIPWSMFISASLPVINRHLAIRQKNDISNYETGVVQLIRWAGLLASGFMVINWFCIKWLVGPLLGQRYLSAGPVAIICTLVIFPLFMGSAQEVWIAHQRTTSVVFKKVLIGLPFSACAIWIGASYYGLIGAAVSMFVSYILTAILLNIFLDRPFFILQLRAIGFGYDRKN